MSHGGDYPDDPDWHFLRRPHHHHPHHRPHHHGGHGYHHGGHGYDRHHEHDRRGKRHGHRYATGFKVTDKFRTFSSTEVGATLAIRTTPRNVTADTFLIPGAFESVTPNLTLEFKKGGTIIEPKWPQANPPIGNQQGCGCCWAYSLAKTAYARYLIHTGQSRPTTKGSKVPTMFSVNGVINALYNNTDDQPQTLSSGGGGGQDPYDPMNPIGPFDPSGNGGSTLTAQSRGCDGGIISNAWYLLNSDKNAVGFQPIFAHETQDSKSTPEFQVPNQCFDSANNLSGSSNPPDFCNSCFLPDVSFDGSESDPSCTPKSVKDVGFVARPLHQSVGNLTNNLQVMYGTMPEWKLVINQICGSKECIPPTSAEIAGSQFSFTNIPFYAACMQHELIHSGPVQIGISIPAIDQLQGYMTPGQDMSTLFMFTENDNSNEGHAMMCTGFQWLDKQYLLSLPKAKQAQYVHGSGSNQIDFLHDKKNYDVKQLAFHIQNQWGADWAFHGCLLMAASFYMVTDHTKNETSFYPLGNDQNGYINQMNGLELNACGGNFWPKEHPNHNRPSKAVELAYHAIKNSIGRFDTSNPAFVHHYKTMIAPLISHTGAHADAAKAIVQGLSQAPVPRAMQRAVFTEEDNVVAHAAQRATHASRAAQAGQTEQRQKMVSYHPDASFTEAEE